MATFLNGREPNTCRLRLGLAATSMAVAGWLSCRQSAAISHHWRAKIHPRIARAGSARAWTVAVPHPGSDPSGRRWSAQSERVQQLRAKRYASVPPSTSSVPRPMAGLPGRSAGTHRNASISPRIETGERTRSLLTAGPSTERCRREWGGHHRLDRGIVEE